jgi:hypothetical protein
MKGVATKNHYWSNGEKNGELIEFVMNSKIEVKLGQLLDICPQLKKIMTKSLLKM